jgi:hypothetical protein
MHVDQSVAGRLPRLLALILHIIASVALAATAVVFCCVIWWKRKVTAAGMCS